MLSCFSLRAQHSTIPRLAKPGPRGGALDDFVKWEVAPRVRQLLRSHSRIYQIPTSSRGGWGGVGGLTLTPVLLSSV